MSALYDALGVGYSRHRAADPRLAEAITRALGDAQFILDVGAGAGSYEPPGRRIVALDASAMMLRQRHGPGPAVAGDAQRLPFADESFDAVMAVLTIHHWDDRAAGYGELRRVAPRQVVVAYEPAVHNELWIVDEYVPEIAELDGRRPGYGVDEIAGAIGATSVEPLLIPHDCTDGFIMAYWRRPEAFLDPEVRRCTSGFSVLDPAVVARAMGRLRADLDTGAWMARHADLLELDEFDAGLRLIVAD